MVHYVYYFLTGYLESYAVRSDYEPFKNERYPHE